MEILLFGALLVGVGIAMKVVSQKRHWNPQLSLSAVIICTGIASIIMYGLIWLDNTPDSKIKITESILKEYINPNKINSL